MSNENRKQAYKSALISQNIPSELADQCSQILVNDENRPRTVDEQKTINKAWQIAFKGTNE